MVSQTGGFSRPPASSPFRGFAGLFADSTMVMPVLPKHPAKCGARPLRQEAGAPRFWGDLSVGDASD